MTSRAARLAEFGELIDARPDLFNLDTSRPGWYRQVGSAADISQGLGISRTAFNGRRSTLEQQGLVERVSNSWLFNLAGIKEQAASVPNPAEPVDPSPPAPDASDADEEPDIDLRDAVSLPSDPDEIATSSGVPGSVVDFVTAIGELIALSDPADITTINRLAHAGGQVAQQFIRSNRGSGAHKQAPETSTSVSVTGFSDGFREKTGHSDEKTGHNDGFLTGLDEKTGHFDGNGRALDDHEFDLILKNSPHTPLSTQDADAEPGQKPVTETVSGSVENPGNQETGNDAEKPEHLPPSARIFDGQQMCCQDDLNEAISAVATALETAGAEARPANPDVLWKVARQWPRAMVIQASILLAAQFSDGWDRREVRSPWGLFHSAMKFGFVEYFPVSGVPATVDPKLDESNAVTQMASGVIETITGGAPVVIAASELLGRGQSPGRTLGDVAMAMADTRISELTGYRELVETARTEMKLLPGRFDSSGVPLDDDARQALVMMNTLLETRPTPLPDTETELVSAAGDDTGETP